MALLFTDSFDHYATADRGAKGWSYQTTGATPGDRGTTIGVYGRNSTNGLRNRLVWDGGASQWAEANKSVTASGTTCILGFGFKVNTNLPTVECGICSIYYGATQNICVTLGTGGLLSVRRGDVTGTVLGTSVLSLSHTTYYFIELKVLFSDTVGTYEVRVNTTNYVSGTGADTVSSGSALFNKIQLGTQHIVALNVLLDYDDVYVCDGSGGVNDNFLGDYRSFNVFPSTGNGGMTDFSLSTGTDHGALVDETTPNTTDYVFSSTLNHIDTFNYPALGITGTVKAVVQQLYAKADSAGIRQIAGTVRISSVNYVHATPQVMGSDYSYYRFEWLLNPATATAWTVGDIDGAEFGTKITT